MNNKDSKNDWFDEKNRDEKFNDKITKLSQSEVFLTFINQARDDFDAYSFLQYDKNQMASNR